MIRAVFAFLLLAAAVPADDAVRSLYDAAAAGDHAKFAAVLDRARSVVDKMPLGAPRNRLRRAIIVANDLDRVWMFDGLYWDEESLPDYYDRLASEYPGFEKFIARFRLVDGSGRVFYPKQETRDFLLKRLQPPNPPKRSP